MRRVARIAVAAGLLVTACAADGPDGPTGQIGADPVPTPAAVVPSGVGVVAEGCSLVAVLGSGVVVESPGQVATAAHTVRGATSITVIDADGDEHGAIVTAFDKDADLALLNAPSLTAPPLLLATAAPGSATLVSWRREDGVRADDVTITRRLNITIEDIYADETVRRTGIEIAAPIDIGQSGGGVVDTGGALVGIVYAASKDRNAVGFATDDRELRNVIADSQQDSVPNGRCG